MHLSCFSSTAHDENKSIQVVKLPIIADFAEKNKKPDFLPLAIPEDILVRLKRVHSKPLVWWIGQTITYILKPQPQTQEFIDNKTTALGFTHPIVGWDECNVLGQLPPGQPPPETTPPPRNYHQGRLSPNSINWGKTKIFQLYELQCI